MFIYEIINAFDEEKLDYVIVGGYALALHGIVRATVDVDLVLNLTLKDFETAEKIFKKLGLESRIPVRAKDIISMRSEYITNRNLKAWSFVDPRNPMRQADILIISDLKNMEVQKIAVGGKKLKVLSLKNLMEMKKESGRPQDLVDIESIKRHLNDKKS